MDPALALQRRTLALLHQVKETKAVGSSLEETSALIEE